MQKGSHHSLETRKLIGKKSLGRYHSFESRKKISKSPSGRYSPWKYRKRTDDEKKKISNSLKDEGIRK
jgi:hypothetical protein